MISLSSSALIVVLMTTIRSRSHKSLCQPSISSRKIKNIRRFRISKTTQLSTIPPFKTVSIRIRTKRILFVHENKRGSRNKIERLLKRKRMRQSCTHTNNFRHISPRNAISLGSIHALIFCVGKQKTSSLRKLVSQNISMFAKTLW